ncbi:hypothetical protein GIB67_041722 [Kingdonia uniflora]|uniref:Protein kinase domain-containing protein n=1 Tax=Kingdonia uniflora TaxID=39325 RepID=A0A7J7MQU1_9MAGN|nr:hypothetical protein GIB67_041722 [Kingdonia uniflora]
MTGDLKVDYLVGQSDYLISKILYFPQGFYLEDFFGHRRVEVGSYCAYDTCAVNILLDEDYVAIVGDFGLAKLLDHRDSNVSTAIRGTVGHIAPEYLSTGQSSEKTDVFGFGILLLELITGQKVLDFGRAQIGKVKKLHQDGKLHLMVDKDLKNNLDLVELEKMVQVALLCTQFHHLHSPKMSEVMRMLEGDDLAEKWDASQKIETPKYQSYENIP